MKRLFLVVGTIMTCAVTTFAQSNVSAPMDFYIEKEVVPAVLNVVPGTLQFVDQDNNNVIDANETCKIRFQVSNTGRGDGYGCVARTTATGNTQGISISDIQLPVIPAGAKQWVEIPITANAYTQTGEIALNIVVNEPNGFGTDPIRSTIHTHKLKTPLVKMTDHKLGSSSSGKLERLEIFKVQILIRNTGLGLAENVQIALNLPQNVVWAGGDAEHISLNSLKSGENKILEYELMANKNAAENSNIQLEISEKQGLYAQNATIPLTFGQYIGGSGTTFDPNPIGPTPNPTGGNVGLTSKVDKDIPISNKKNNKTFAVIIANEKYESVASVPFALNDGRIFREYCIKTLGIPEKQVKYLPNATGNQIKAQVTWLQNICEVFEDAQIIFYYAGHGIPDESSRTAYLLPVDGIGTDISTGYKLDNLYAALGKIPAKNVTVFMDACFSGSKREDGMLASARGVAIKARSGMPQGNMVVFSAAQGDETAYPNNEEKHGMFTYYLLKKLQDTKGDVTLQELGDYIIKNVSQQSILLNGKRQTPCVTPSTILGEDWKFWSLK